MMISRIILLFMISVQVLYSIKLKKHEIKDSKIQIEFEVEDDLIGISNFHKYENEDYFFIDSIFKKIEIIKPLNFEIIDSILEINLMDKDPNYSYYVQNTEIKVGGCCSFSKGSTIYIVIDSINAPINYIKIGYNKYDSFKLSK